MHGPARLPVLISTPRWEISGCNTQAQHLVRGMLERGVDARIVLSHDDDVDAPTRLQPPRDVPQVSLSLARLPTWTRRWRAFARFLERNAPCIYIPQYDFHYSCVCPLLSRAVRVVGTVQSDDPRHYEHLGRLGPYWDAIVVVSTHLRDQALARLPATADRLYVIPNAVPVPAAMPPRQWERDGALRLLYTGRLVDEQKRVQDLPAILRRVLQAGVPARLTIVGKGPVASRLAADCTDLVARGLVDFVGGLAVEDVERLYEEHDVYVLPSAFEGMPLGVLEAMSRGCLPVVSDVASGLRELVVDGENGYRVAVGDIEGFAQRIVALAGDPGARARMAHHAYRTVKAHYDAAAMVDAYLAVFEQVELRRHRGAHVRLRGPALPPKDLPPWYLEWIPPAVRSWKEQWFSASRTSAR